MNTMERMVLCAAIQQDIGTLLDILDAVDLMTATYGEPPEDVRAILDAQLSVGIDNIFRHAVQA